MSTDPMTIEFLLDQLGGRGASFTSKRMFGEYCLYRDLLPVAFVCDDVLFVKDTAAGREAIACVMTPQFGPPYPGAKLYLRLDPDAWDDGDWLRRVLDATAAELPAAKPKAAKRKPAGASAAGSVPSKARSTPASETPARTPPTRPSKTAKTATAHKRKTPAGKPSDDR